MACDTDRQPARHATTAKTALTHVKTRLFNVVRSSVMKDQTGPCVKWDSTACKQFWPDATNDSYGCQHDLNPGSLDKIPKPSQLNLGCFSLHITNQEWPIYCHKIYRTLHQAENYSSKPEAREIMWREEVIFCRLTEMCFLVHSMSVIRHLAPRRQYAGMLTAMVNILTEGVFNFCSSFDWQDTKSCTLNNFQMWWLRVHKPNREWCNHTIS